MENGSGKTNGNGRSKWLTLGLMGLGAVAQQCRKGLVDLAQIENAICHLRALRGLRQLCLVFLQIVLGTMFISIGVVMLHVFVVLLLAAQVPARKLWILFGVSMGEVSLAAAYLIWFFSSSRWVRKAARHNPLIEKVSESRKTMV